jgi:deazaflavin-dependent oxidoreductase (nitroreductase family)
MTTGTVRGSKPRGLLRFFLRFPIWLYRLHLGWLLGDRFVMFRHIGRKSGLPRYTVVEVVRHDRSTDTYTIASGWGEKSDWFQNIQKEPEILLYIGRRQMAATVNRLSVEEATQALQDYADRHPTAFNKLSKMMVGQTLEGNEADCHLLAQSVPLVMLTPHH